MSKVEQIQAFKATDGKVFEDKEQAEKYQDELNYREKLTKIFENEWYRGIDMEDVIDLLVKNRDKL